MLVLLREPQGIAVIDDGVETLLFERTQMLGDEQIFTISDPAPDIDDSGRVVFSALLGSFEGPSCDDKILLSGAALPTPLAEGGAVPPGCPFLHLDTLIPLALNDVGSDPVEDKVLAVGDALCDDVVTEIYFHRYGLNDSDELALGVALSDGRQLIVRAEPGAGPGGECIRFPVPEPDGVLGAVVAVAALAALAGGMQRS